MNIEELNTQLEYLSETKGLIKQAIINKGQNIGENDTFRSFVQKINDIETDIETNRVPIWFMYLNTGISYTLEELLEYKTSLSFDIHRSNVHICLFRVDDFDDVIRETPQIGDFVYVSSIKLLKEIDGVVEPNIPYFAFGQIDSTAHTEYYISGTFKVIDATYNENFTNALKIIPGNIKNGIEILGVTGKSSVVDTDDANATSNDIIFEKTAYVNGQKIIGTYVSPVLPYGRMLDNLDNINNTQISLRQDLSAITFVGDISGYSTTSGESYPITDCKIDGHSSMAVLANQSDVATAIGLTSAKIKSGETILGVQGSVVELNGDTETVTPTTSQQIITPTSPKNGLTQVTVNAVTSAIDNNIQASNIKNGVTILGVQGTYSGIDTSDATATPNDLPMDITAYVNGQKITGVVPTTGAGGGMTYGPDNITISETQDYLLGIRQNIPVNIMAYSGANLGVQMTKSDVASTIGLTANKIKLGETILGVTGTYSDAMKSYNNENAMNNDIANIANGEVVKVVVTTGIPGDPDAPTTTTITYYIKEAGTPAEWTPVDLSQYQVGDTMSLKGKKLAKSFTAVGASEYGPGENATLTLEGSGGDVLEITIMGRSSGIKGNVYVGDNEYSYTKSGTETFTLSDNDVETINNMAMWLSDTQLTISNSSIDLSVISGAILEQTGGTSDQMVKLVKENETISPQEYQENIELADDILGETE